MTFVEGRVEVTGRELRYLESGQGAPLVHLHGGDGLRVTPAHELIARHFRVIALEIPHFEQSADRPQPGSKAVLADTVAQAVKSLGIERFDLWGTSASARTALWLALQAPDLVRSLVLEAPAPVRSEGLASRPDAPAPAAPPGEPRLRRDADLERRLPELRTPTLAVFGTRDDLAPPEMGRVYKELLPNAHLVFVYDAGHNISADRPDAFAEVVSDFIERHEAFVISRTATVIHP